MCLALRIRKLNLSNLSDQLNMQTLVIDAGNTRIKAAIFENALLQHHAVFDYAEWRNNMGLWLQDFAPQKTLISDVGKRLNWESSGVFTHAIELGPELEMPFKNNYLSKETLGADRKALVAGAQYIYPGESVLIIDAGTCVTFDLLKASQEYEGGSISPGLQMRLQAMYSFTGKLPQVPYKMPGDMVGKDTQACMLSGAYFGLVGEIEYLIARYSELYAGLKVILSGGDAAELAKNIKTSIFVNEHLLLIGLNQILIHHAD